MCRQRLARQSGTRDDTLENRTWIREAFGIENTEAVVATPIAVGQKRHVMYSIYDYEPNRYRKPGKTSRPQHI